MKITEEKIVPEKKEIKTVGLQCDLCGQKSQKEFSWSSSRFGVDENEIKIYTVVKRSTGDSYPEGGHGDEYAVDLCPSCFTGRLIPWLKSQGAEIKETEWEW